MMNSLYTAMIGISIVAALLTGHGSELAAAIPKGAQSGITLALSIAGPLCLWSGISTLMEKIGTMDLLHRMLKPVLYRIFPSARTNRRLANAISGNICANLLGLGNAATPLGLRAVEHLTASEPGYASDELCRLIVLNTASIQLIPINVAAIRSALGTDTPFDILPAVWITSLCAGVAGLSTAFIFGKIWKK